MQHYEGDVVKFMWKVRGERIALVGEVETDYFSGPIVRIRMTYFDGETQVLEVSKNDVIA